MRKRRRANPSAGLFVAGDGQGSADLPRPSEKDPSRRASAATGGSGAGSAAGTKELPCLLERKWQPGAPDSREGFGTATPTPAAEFHEVDEPKRTPPPASTRSRSPPDSANGAPAPSNRDGRRRRLWKRSNEAPLRLDRGEPAAAWPRGRHRFASGARTPGRAIPCPRWRCISPANASRDTNNELSSPTPQVVPLRSPRTGRPRIVH